MLANGNLNAAKSATAVRPPEAGAETDVLELPSQNPPTRNIFFQEPEKDEFDLDELLENFFSLG
jgi:hypothetical protein